jgi:hypothetical protein
MLESIFLASIFENAFGIILGNIGENNNAGREKFEYRTIACIVEYSGKFYEQYL